MLQHLPFIARNAARNRRRSILTVASVAVSLCLLGVLMGMYTFLFYPDDQSPSQALRLVVHHRVSLAQSLPAAYYDKIKNVEGVQGITVWQWFGGTYKDARDPNNFFARLGVDPNDFFNVRTDIEMPQDQRDAFIHNQTGCIASQTLAEKMGWKLGERITLVGDIFPVNLELTLVGIFNDPNRDEVLHYNDKYLQQSLDPAGGQRDTTGAYLVLADAPEHVARIGRVIDAMFDNSPAPTKSESEKDFALSFLSFLGNLKLFLAAFSGAVVFTILLVSANTVAMTVRERVRETAILRTLGFTPPEIRGLILGESGLLSLVGGVIGGACAWLICDLSYHSNFSLRLPMLKPWMAGAIVAFAVIMGVCSAVLPAYFASRRKIVDSMRYAG
ncbi:MAG: FtsX-like permease family protein [Tepidisphaeraceae bacterium]|jgi:putative ABC transport system permease protein